MLERSAEQPRLTSTADICTQRKMTPSHFSFVSHFPLAFFPFWLLQGWKGHLLAATQTSEKTQQVHLAQSNPEKSLLAMSRVQLFPTAAPKAARLADSNNHTQTRSAHNKMIQSIINLNKSRDAKKSHCSPSHSTPFTVGQHLWDSTPFTIVSYLPL